MLGFTHEFVTLVKMRYESGTEIAVRKEHASIAEAEGGTRVGEMDAVRLKVGVMPEIYIPRIKVAKPATKAKG